MAVRAAKLPLGDWSASLNQSEGHARDELVTNWEITEEQVHIRLGLLEVCTIDDASLRVSAIEALEGVLEDGDPELALVLLGDFLIDNLMVRLTASDMWEFLRSKGFTPRIGPDLAASERMRTVTDRYISAVVSARPTNLPLVDRDEVQQIIDMLTTTGGPSTVVLIGPPGGGKSTVASNVCRGLRDVGVLVGALRLDEADPTHTATELGNQEAIGFGGSPSRVLARAAAGRPAVLVVDQLDALSMLAGRGDAIVGGVREMFEQAHASGPLRILVTCRQHDLTYDPRLRQLTQTAAATAGDDPTSGSATVTLGDLRVQQVVQALEALGVDPATALPRLRHLLGRPFNLGLLARIVEIHHADGVTGPLDLTTISAQNDLLHRYHAAQSRHLRTALGRNGYAQTVFQLAGILSEGARLSLPRSRVADIADSIDTLVHEGVLVEDGHQIRFFHEAYFDYVYALDHVRQGRTATDLVRDDSQDLVRRGQVRAILALERQDAGPAYVDDLRSILDPDLVRSHLRSAVLTWLKDQPVATRGELQAILEVATNHEDPLRGHAARVLGSSPFASRLGADNLLPVAAARLVDRPDQSTDEFVLFIRRLDAVACANLLCESARHVPELAAAAVLPFAVEISVAAQWIGALLQMVFLAGPTAGPVTAELLSIVVSASTSAVLAAHGHPSAADQLPPTDNSLAGHAVMIVYGINGKHALKTLAKRVPHEAAKVIALWLEDAERLMAAGVNLGRANDLLHQQSTGLHIFENCAEGAPAEFLGSVLPYMVGEYDAAATPRRDDAEAPREEKLRYDTLRLSGSYRSIAGEIYDALEIALRLCAVEDVDTAREAIHRLIATDLVTAHQLAASAFTVCTPPLLDEALEWAAQPRVRGLSHGYTTAWAWGEVLAHAAAIGNEEQRGRVTELLVSGYEELNLAELVEPSSGRAVDDLQRVGRAAAEVQLIALSLVARRAGDISAELAAQLTTLDELVGPPPEKPITESADLWPRESPSAAPLVLTDQQWLNVINGMTAHTTVNEHDINANRLRAAAKAEPCRFAALVMEIDPTAEADFVKAILDGFKTAAPDLTDGESAAVIDASQTIGSWQRDEFNLHLCLLVGNVADRDVPDGVIALITAIATTSSPSTSGTTDPVTSAYQRDRGQAILALADLLAPGQSRAERVQHLLPTVRALVEDPDPRVQALLPRLINRIYLVDQPAATELAAQWAVNAPTAVLGAPETGRLSWLLFLGRPESGVQFVRRLINSEDPTVRSLGGEVTTHIFLSRDLPVPHTEAEPLVDHALGNAECRTGVAIVLAASIDQLLERSHDDRSAIGYPLLIKLLDDDNPDVRNAAANFGFNLPRSLTRAAEFLAAAANSRAFLEDPGPTLHALSRAGETLPIEALDLCERWLDHNFADAGDIQTRAAGDAYEVVDLVLTMHGRSELGSPERLRCLALLDRLVEAGAIDADKRTDEVT